MHPFLKKWLQWIKNGFKKVLKEKIKALGKNENFLNTKFNEKGLNW